MTSFHLPPFVSWKCTSVFSTKRNPSNVSCWLMWKLGQVQVDVCSCASPMGDNQVTTGEVGLCASMYKHHFKVKHMIVFIVDTKSTQLALFPHDDVVRHHDDVVRYQHHTVLSPIGRSAMVNRYQCMRCVIVIRSSYFIFHIHALMFSVHVALGLPLCLFKIRKAVVTTKCGQVCSRNLSLPFIITSSR